MYYEVTSVDGGTVHTKSDTAGLSSISSSLVENTAFTTDQFEREERVTRTQMSQKMETFGHAASASRTKRRRRTALPTSWSRPT